MFERRIAEFMFFWSKLLSSTAAKPSNKGKMSTERRWFFGRGLSVENHARFEYIIVIMNFNNNR